jgi:hypothetical protein
MSFLINSIKNLEKDKKPPCNGPVYRASVRSFQSTTINGQERLNFNIQLNRLKRKSCPGCEQCGYIYDYLDEIVENDEIEGVCDVEDKKLYRFEFVEDGYDYEGGYCDDWHLKLVEFKEKQ